MQKCGKLKLQNFSKHAHTLIWILHFFQIITIHLKQKRGRGRKIQKMKNVKMFCHNVTKETQEFSKCLTNLFSASWRPIMLSINSFHPWPLTGFFDENYRQVSDSDTQYFLIFCKNQQAKVVIPSHHWNTCKPRGLH